MSGGISSYKQEHTFYDVESYTRGSECRRPHHRVCEWIIINGQELDCPQGGWNCVCFLLQAG